MTSFDNQPYDDLYRESQPNPDVLERKVNTLRAIGAVAGYQSLEEYDIDAIDDTWFDTEEDKELREDVLSLRQIERHIGYEALIGLLDEHEEKVDQELELLDITSDSKQDYHDAEDHVRAQLDKAFIRQNLGKI